MAVEIGLRIKAENMTGQDFDQLVADLQRTGQRTDQLKQSADNLGQTFDTLGNKIQQTAKLTLDANARWQSAEGNILNTQQASKQLETALAAVSDEQLRQINVFRDAEGRLQDIRTGYISNAEAARRYAQGLERTTAEFASADREAETFSNTLAQQLTQLQHADSNLQAAVVPVRNFKLELITLNATLSETEHAFRNVSDTTELERATQNRLTALDALTQVTRDEIEAQRAIEHATLSRLSTQEQAESEHAKNIRELTAQLQQLAIDYEQEKTQITREAVEKRTQFHEKATQLRIDFAKREADARLKAHNAVFAEISSTLREIDDTQTRNRTFNIFGHLLTQDVAPQQALDQAQDFIILIDGMGNSLRTFETGTRAFGAIFRREVTETLQTGITLLGELGHRLRAPELAALAENVRGIDAISRLEAGQADRDQRTADIFASGAARFQESEHQFIDQGRAYVSRLRQQQPFSFDTLTAGTGDLIASVPLDVVDAVTENIQVRRDGNAELLRIEQEAAAEIQIIQESVTLSAMNKAAAIERVERQSALQRIRIENEVSERQRASFQSVVTDFLSGIAQMIAAEAQLALARRATNALSALFSGSGAAASAGLLSGVLLPLLGGLGLAYGASRLISRSPSAEVYQRSQYVSDDGSIERTNRNVSQNPGTTRASQETGTPTLEANLNVTVEASGTRLGQANSRVQLKTSRWGG